jgi:transcriptional regulator with XRE-family HTH domain
MGTFAELLKQYRQACGLTQEALAERANLSSRAISDLERGVKQAPHATTVRLLIQGLGLDSTTAVQFTAAAAPRRTAQSAASPGNLPTALTSFVGRERELAQIRHALEAARLVTLVGWVAWEKRVWRWRLLERRRGTMQAVPGLSSWQALLTPASSPKPWRRDSVCQKSPASPQRRRWPGVRTRAGCCSCSTIANI